MKNYIYILRCNHCILGEKKVEKNNLRVVFFIETYLFGEKF